MHRVRKWGELLGIMSLVVGVGLVILQLRQNEQLVRFQIASEVRMNRDNDRNVTRGDQYSTTLAKLQTTPEDMTDAELVQFDAHARSLISELQLRRILAENGIFQGDWKSWLQAESCDLFDNPIGRAWLKTQGPSFGEEMIDELEHRIGECASRTSFLKSVREGQSQ